MKPVSKYLARLFGCWFYYYDLPQQECMCGFGCRKSIICLCCHNYCYVLHNFLILTQNQLLKPSKLLFKNKNLKLKNV